MRVIVTGATSFIGKAVTKELLAGGHHVFAVVRPDSPGRGRLERPGAEAGEKTGEETGEETGNKAGMPWIPFTRQPVWGAPGFFFAAPRPSTALRTALWARRFCAILSLNTERTSWRYAAGQGKRQRPWGLIISMPGYSAFTVPETIPGPWCPPASIPFLKEAGWSLGHVPSSGISFM